MEIVRRIISFLIILSGIGHIYFALNFDNQPMFMKMIVGGIIYLILGVLVWQNNKRALIVSSIIMLLAGIGSSFSIHDIGYPVSQLMYFLGVNCAVVLLSALYFIKTKFVREQSN